MRLSKEGKPEEMVELLPMLWMILVAFAFLLIAAQPHLFPALRRTEEVPGIAELERLVLPLLLALGAGGIIRRRWLRVQASRSRDSAVRVKVCGSESQPT